MLWAARIKRIFPPGLAVSLAAALLLCVGSVAFALLHLRQLMSERVADWLQTQSLATASLRPSFTAYAVALIAIHAALGFAIWGLAEASSRTLKAARLSVARWATVWGLVIVAWVLIANAALFPRSIFAEPFSSILLDHEARVILFRLLTPLLLAAVAAVVLPVLLPTPHARRVGVRVAVYGVMAVAALQVVQWMEADALATADVPADSNPNIILIGIDSLRPDMVGASNEHVGFTPALDDFLDEAVTFEDTVTPLGRTYAAWVSILTGRAPVHTGVRDNLLPRSLVKADGTIAQRLKAAGYRTIYATDEVRFSYIDETYGFDQVVSPRMGATDFMLGSFNEMPLPNLIANTVLGRWLFPNTYANRSSSATYRIETFVDWVDDAIEFDGPTLFATHLTLPHYPYFWGEGEEETFSEESRISYAYASSVIEADRQFEMLMQKLERKGALHNAIVVVLSDHGEGLGLSRDNLIYSREAKRVLGPLSVSMYGHGNSVLSPYQYQVVLAMRRYGGAPFKSRAIVDVPATLEDVTPTLLDLVGVDLSGATFDGVSWASLLATGEHEVIEPERIRYTETGLVVGFQPGGKVDEGSLADRSIRKYGMEVETGRLVLLPEALAHIVRTKERAAFTPQRILAAVPDIGGERMRYVEVNKETGDVLPRDVAPTAAEPESLRLWNALHEHFKGELGQSDATLVRDTQTDRRMRDSQTEQDSLPPG